MISSKWLPRCLNVKRSGVDISKLRLELAFCSWGSPKANLIDAVLIYSYLVITKTLLLCYKLFPSVHSFCDLAKWVELGIWVFLRTHQTFVAPLKLWKLEKIQCWFNWRISSCVDLATYHVWRGWIRSWLVEAKTWFLHLACHVATQRSSLQCSRSIQCCMCPECRSHRVQFRRFWLTPAFFGLHRFHFKGIHSVLAIL